jgi:hypothetical protein
MPKFSLSSVENLTRSAQSITDNQGSAIYESGALPETSLGLARGMTQNRSSDTDFKEEQPIDTNIASVPRELEEKDM